MRKYYKLTMIPAAIVIIAVISSGFTSFGEQSHEATAKNLLKERTGILQSYYYSHHDKEKTSEHLKKIETYPLLSKDIENLVTEDGCQADKVNSMEITKITETMKLFHFVSFDVSIDWDMSGLCGDYMTDGNYTVVMKSEGGEYKLSEFNIK